MDAGPPSLEIGTGTRIFTPLANDGTIFVVLGPQGGFHLNGSLRAHNLEAGDAEDLSNPNNPTITFEVFKGNTRIDAMASTYTQGLKMTQEGAEMVGRQIILAITSDSELDGVMVRFVVTVRDITGISVRDERSLLVRPHPNNAPSSF